MRPAAFVKPNYEESAFEDLSNLHRNQAVDVVHSNPKNSGGEEAIVSSTVNPVPASTDTLSSSSPGVEKMNHFEELRHFRDEMSAIKDEMMKEVQSQVACILDTVRSKIILERLADETAVEQRDDINSKGIGSDDVTEAFRNENASVLEGGENNNHLGNSGGYDHAAESEVSARPDYCLMARNQSVESDSSEDTDSEEEKEERWAVIHEIL